MDGQQNCEADAEEIISEPVCSNATKNQGDT